MLAVRPFLDGRVRDGDELDLAGLSAADVVAFVVARCPAQSRGAAKMTVTALRSLLGFLHLRGLIARAAWSTRCRRRRRGGCRGCRARWSPSSWRRCWARATASTATGRRDYAVLVMLARLGLRARRGRRAEARGRRLARRRAGDRRQGPARRAAAAAGRRRRGDRRLPARRAAGDRPGPVADRARPRSAPRPDRAAGSRRSCSPRLLAPGWARSTRTGCVTPPPHRCCGPARALRRSARCCATARC